MQNFISWLMDKLKVKTYKKIGMGLSGIVYDIGRGRVLKITEPNTQNQNPIINKNILRIVKTYHTGLIHVPKKFIDKSTNLVKLGDETLPLKDGKSLGYIIMEKLETKRTQKEVEELEEIMSYFSENNNHDIYELSYLMSYYRDGKKVFYSFKKEFLEKYSHKSTLFEEVEECIKTILKYYGGYSDLTPEQFGRNKFGVLKVFDLSNDSEDYEDLSMYKPVKNIVKEDNLSLSESYQKRLRKLAGIN